jgi:hypothetical protein
MKLRPKGGPYLLKIFRTSMIRKSGNRFPDKIMLKCKEAARVSAGNV